LVDFVVMFRKKGSNLYKIKHYHVSTSITLFGMNAFWQAYFRLAIVLIC